jgi:hypothetical protein
MTGKRILAISRAERFSPNSVDKDRAILQAVCCQLQAAGYADVRIESEEQTGLTGEADVYVTMARSHKALAWLEKREQQGCIVINSTRGISLCCRRYDQMRLLEAHGVPVAPANGDDGYWVKRGDMPAETPADVLFVPDWSSAVQARAAMVGQGAAAVDVRAHVGGDLIKFYGVEGTGFFRCFYPGDDGQSKFGDEQHNGCPHHYAYDEAALQAAAEHAARITATSVYGGDCIVRPDGTFALVDFNDWPSFSRCRDAAAQAIAAVIIKRMQT